MITEQIQAMIDRHVAGSPRARQLLTELDGRRLMITARFTPWRITLLSRDAQLVLTRQDPATADATITGTPFALLTLLREDPADVIRRGDVTIGGDAELAARFQELLQLLRPDLEAGLARVVGDIPAYGTGLLLRKALDYGRSTVRTAATNAGEYLAHEKQVLVPRAEAEQYLQEVDTLREQADRLAVRVAALESAASGSGTTPQARSAP